MARETVKVKATVRPAAVAPSVAPSVLKNLRKTKPQQSIKEHNNHKEYS